MSLDPQSGIQQILLKKLEEYRFRNPNFSIRALAKKLRISSSAVNEILHGKRNVSKKMAYRISTNLNLDPSETLKIQDLFERKSRIQNQNHSSPETLQNHRKLHINHFKLITDWIHFAILSLSKTKFFSPDPASIARRLGRSTRETEDALKRLESLNLIRRAPQFSILQEQVETTDDISDISIRRSHLNDLVLAEQKLHLVPVHLRDFTSYTFAVNTKKIGPAKLLIRKFQDDLEALLSDGDSSEVYRVCVQLFPLTVHDSIPKSEITSNP